MDGKRDACKVEIKRGDEVRALTATNEWVVLRAASGVTAGADFPIVWLCSEQDWQSLRDDSLGGIPWPAESVEPIEEETSQ